MGFAITTLSEFWITDFLIPINTLHSLLHKKKHIRQLQGTCAAIYCSTKTLLNFCHIGLMAHIAVCISLTAAPSNKEADCAECVTPRED